MLSITHGRPLALRLSEKSAGSMSTGLLVSRLWSTSLRLSRSLRTCGRSSSLVCEDDLPYPPTGVGVDGTRGPGVMPRPGFLLRPSVRRPLSTVGDRGRFAASSSWRTRASSNLVSNSLIPHLPDHDPPIVMVIVMSVVPYSIQAPSSPNFSNLKSLAFPLMVCGSVDEKSK